ncbi:MAG TPA: 30S ribosomal protein S13 [Dehalococcoidia bacterium]|nr:30S ribosomal protein S13 [Dehalococcoidia bacterium]
MARISGVDIPNDKQIGVALCYIYGIGRARVLKILGQARIEPRVRVRELTDDEINRIREVIDREYIVEGDLRREVRQNVQHLIEINCYRGIRHRRGLPVHGQRTRTNARTKRGARRTVAGKRRSIAKK